MSDLILCAKRGRCEGEGAFGESGKGRLLALCSLARLKHIAVAEHRLVQHGVGNHPLEEEGRV